MEKQKNKRNSGIGRVLICLLLCASEAKAAGPQPCYFQGAFTKCFTTSGILVPQISWTDTTKGIVGTTTNDSAGSGYVGEQIIQTRVASAAVTLTNATAANVTSSALSLTAGDWDVDGVIGISATTGVTTDAIANISVTSATLSGGDTQAVADASGQMRISFNNFNLVSGVATIDIPVYRISISSTTSFFLVTLVNFSAGTLKAFGSIRARRVR